MPINITMPALSPTMEEGNLASWNVKEGDAVESGDVIAEIETDKATMEVEAVDDGTIGKILVPAGTENVKVNDVIAVLLEEGESADDIGDVSAEKSADSIAEADDATNQEAPEAEQSATQDSTQTQTDIPKDSIEGGRVKASPLAKRLAKENNLDLYQLTGSGPRGRIIKVDIEQALKSGTGKAGASAPATQVSGDALPAGPDARKLADAYGMAYEEEKASGMRKTVAQRLTEAKQTVPHFYLTIDAEIDNLLALRKQINEAADGEYKVSVNDFIIKACAMALKKVPEANASWAGDAILKYKHADISVAVATPGGLITPIVKTAEEKSLSQISIEMKDLASRARDGKLKPTEYQGGTFSLSNLGMFGIKKFDAIINPPQGCILAVGAGEQVPVVKNGEIKIATKMHATLSVDHRVVDGAVGAEFLQALKIFLEQPVTMLA